MSEEFKPIRITLSEEAFDRMEKIMKGAKFRSASSTIEECIRVVFDIIGDVYLILGSKGAPITPFDDAQAARAFETIATRMDRFTGRVVVEKIEKVKK